jgi:hypothetical protein
MLARITATCSPSCAILCEGMHILTTFFILNDPPYGTERRCSEQWHHRRVRIVYDARGVGEADLVAGAHR